MAGRLKVFVTSDGLTDYVVAVSSRAKALAAWGVRQDVFKEGQARETDDPALLKAALAQPGEVLRRPAHGRGAPAELKPASAVRPAKPVGPSKAQLKKLADLEARLAKLETAHRRARDAMEAEAAGLERRRQALTERQAGERSGLQASLTVARKALG